MEERGTPLLLAVIFGSLASLALVVLVAVIMTLLGYKDTEPLAMTTLPNWAIRPARALSIRPRVVVASQPGEVDPKHDLPDDPGERVYQKDGVRRISIPIKKKDDSGPS